jgi:hypothetical protein
MVPLLRGQTHRLPGRVTDTSQVFKEGWGVGGFSLETDDLRSRKRLRNDQRRYHAYSSKTYL